ncbi:MAG: GNAT family N-acetyltransferase [Colwellia sp.]|nr:GNAT family N-acetyltransferase [Colwellia sp.]
MKNLIIRKALLKDKEQLLNLEQEVVEAERPFNTSIKPNDAIYYDMAKLLNDDTSHLLVAEFEGQIIATGYAQIRTSKTSLKHNEHSYLGFMYVVPEFRGLGINGQIMNILIDWSKEQGVSDLYLDVYEGNDAAIRAYEKIGFAKSMVEMKLDLEE